MPSGDDMSSDLDCEKIDEKEDTNFLVDFLNDHLAETP